MKILQVAHYKGKYCAAIAPLSSIISCYTASNMEKEETKSQTAGKISKIDKQLNHLKTMHIDETLAKAIRAEMVSKKKAAGRKLNKKKASTKKTVSTKH